MQAIPDIIVSVGTQTILPLKLKDSKLLSVRCEQIIPRTKKINLLLNIYVNILRITFRVKNFL